MPAMKALVNLSLMQLETLWTQMNWLLFCAIPCLDPDSAEEEPLLQSLLRLLLWFRCRCFRWRLWCFLCLQCSSPPLHLCFLRCFFNPTANPPSAEANKRFSFSRLLFLRRFLSRILLGLLLLRSLNCKRNRAFFKQYQKNIYIFILNYHKTVMKIHGELLL